MAAERRYNQEEVREILRRVQRPTQDLAPTPTEGLSRAELLETAREVGFTSEQMTAALTEYEGERDIEKAQQELRQLAYRRFSGHLINYLLINGMILGLNLWLGPPFWFVLPLLVWGVLILFHLRAVLFPDPDRLRKDAQNRLSRRSLKESSKELGQALTKGASHLLAATAKRIDQEVDRLGRK